MANDAVAMSGVFCRLTFADDVEPRDFLADLKAKVAAAPDATKQTRAGKFEGLSVFRWSANRVSDDGKVQPVAEYVFVVKGFPFGGVPEWLVTLLESYGKVSTPLDDKSWDWSAGGDIGV
jgi:hypothetical protein